MSDIERAIEWINGLIANFGFEQRRLLVDESMAIKKALEKQTPKKPTEIDYDCSYFVCPSCGESIYASDNLETHKFCLECGQAIDWSINTKTK